MGYQLERMTWPDAQQAIRSTQAVLFPTGSIEQHGKHLPLGTDYLIAKELANRVCANTDRIVVAPTIPVGFAEYHTDFAGTLSLSTETLGRAYLEPCESMMKYGVKRFVFLNGHGGNRASLTWAIRKLRDQGIIAASLQWFDICATLNKEWFIVGHADYLETSLMMAIAPASVRTDQFEAPQNKHLSNKLQVSGIGIASFRGIEVSMGLRTSDGTNSGLISERCPPEGSLAPTLEAASAALGEQILSAVTDYIIDFIESLEKVAFK